MKKTLSTGVGVVALVAGSLALAGPAHASQTNCTAKGESYVTDSTTLVSAAYSTSPRRCTVITDTVAQPVASGEIEYGDLQSRIVAEYESDPDVVLGDLVDSTEPEVIYGDWVVGSDIVTTVVSGAGKSKNTRTTTTTVTTYTRTVISSVTHTYEAFSVTYELQDVEFYREGEQPTTVTTTRTTRIFSVDNNGVVGGLSPQQPASTTTTGAGEPTAVDDLIEDLQEGIQVLDEGAAPVEASREEVTPTEENGGVVVEDTPMEDETQTVIVKETCVDNKNKSKNRTACTAPTD